MSNTDELRRVWLFEGLTEDQLDSLSPFTYRKKFGPGELIVEEQFGAQAVKLAAGDMVLYPSSSLHQVAPVTRGQRICAISWIQSAVADTPARALLYDLDQSIRALTPDREKDDPEINRLIHVYHNLLRRWAQP